MAVHPTALTVFADIDGVLASVPAQQLERDVAALTALGSSVAVVLCSGRTRPEIEHLMHALGIRHPFISEHGAALFVPDGYFPFEIPNAVPIAGYQVVEFGRSSASVVDALRRVADRQRIPLRLFSEMSVDEVASECGVSPLDARLAKLRDYGEMCRLVERDDHAHARLLDALRAAHLRCITGTPFDHVGAAVDISIGVGLLRTLYRRAFGAAITVGVADWLADGDVLQLVECPVVIASPSHTQPSRAWRRGLHPRAVPFEGERGWGRAVVEIIREQYPTLATVGVG